MHFQFRLVFTLTLLGAVIAGAKPKERRWPEFANSPWNGHYLHTSGKFELEVNQFSKDAVDVDIFPIPRSDEAHESHFFADLHKDVATLWHKDEPDCRVDLKKVSEGIVMTSHCLGMGDDDGLYRRVSTKAGK